MTEVIGKCLSVDAEKMIILDDDNDEIEMSNKGATESLLTYFRAFIGKRISYYYDHKGISVRPLNADDLIVYDSNGLRRTLSSITKQGDRLND